MLPVSRTIKDVTAPLGINWGPFGGMGGLNIEAPIRRAAGLPEVDRFEAYRTDRMIVNMIADGDVSLEEGNLAMNSDSGPIFDEAMRRVNQARFFGTYANPLWYLGFPADSFPPGEAKMRGLQGEWEKAFGAFKAGDRTAIDRFFEVYPEFQARLQLFKDKPDERLRSFMVDEIWTRYFNLGSADKEWARQFLGEDFGTAFLDKETRNYEGIPLEVMASWAQMLGAKVPEHPRNGIELPKVEPMPQLPQEVSGDVDAFRAARTEKFPDYSILQDGYFNRPPGARKAYLEEHPRLRAYWDWRNGQYTKFPLVKLWASSMDMADSSGAQLASIRVPEILANPVLMRQLYAHQVAGQGLSSGALEMLMWIWESMGSPDASLNAWIDGLDIQGQPGAGQGGYSPAGQPTQ